MKRIMGFDVSSSVIGWALLEIDDKNNISFIKCGNYKPPKKGTIIERLFITRNAIKKIIEEYKPDYIGIEDIIQFMQNKSSAKTIITLALFNRMIGLLSHDYLGSSPALFSVLGIRHGLKLNKVLPKKEDIPELVATHLSITFPYTYKRNGKISDESGDMADAIATGLYYAFNLTGRLKKKK